MCDINTLGAGLTGKWAKPSSSLCPLTGLKEALEVPLGRDWRKTEIEELYSSVSFIYAVNTCGASEGREFGEWFYNQKEKR